MEITRETFTKALEEAVAERGEDFVYPEEWKSDVGTCQYSVDGEPACLIGLALNKLGVAYRPHWEGGSASSVLEKLHVHDYVLIRAARYAQGIQDRGESWGSALAEYRRMLEE